MTYRPPAGNVALTSPLDLPVAVGKSLTTQSGTILDNGSGGLTADHVNATPNTAATLTPAVSPLVSGTIYQNLTGGPVTVMQALTGTTAGTAQIALGSASAPPAYGGAESILLASIKNIHFVVPDKWYCSITAASSTFGTLDIIGL